MKHRFKTMPGTGCDDLFSLACRSFETICPPLPLGNSLFSARRIHHSNVVILRYADPPGIGATISGTSVFSRWNGPEVALWSQGGCVRRVAIHNNGFREIIDRQNKKGADR